ncbi:hypothetical protein Tco_1047040, partial [Tanacetum coccineum]
MGRKDEDVLNDDGEESEGDIHENFQEEQDWKNREAKIEPNNIGESIHSNVANKVQREETNQKTKEIKEVDGSNLSCPPGFEHLKNALKCSSSSSLQSKTSRCSTSFRKYIKKDVRGISIIHEMSRLIEISAKSSLLSQMLDVIRTHEGHFIIFGDMNEVRDESERSYILINGSSSSEFSIKRGLRQGDPLGPFLFIIIMEGLHIALKDAVQSGLLRGAKVVSSDVTIDTARATGCASGTIPFVYIGLPIGSNTNLKANWQSLIDRFHESVLKTLESIRDSFFWGGSGDRKKMTWVKSRHVMASLDKGGLGVGSLKSFNLVYSSQRHHQGSQRSLEDILVSWDGYHL